MRNIIIMLSLLLGVIVLSACSEEKKVDVTGHIAPVSDVRHVANLEEAVRYSDLVVIGTVDKVHPATNRNISTDKSDPFYAVYTDLDIKAEQIIFGDINQGTNDMFTMKQLGGIYDGKEYPTYEPILEEGKTYLFFLATFDKYGDPEEPYTLVGTDEIVAPVEDGVVKFHPSLPLTDPLATKQIKDETYTDHDAALKIDDVIAEIIRIDNCLPEPIYNIDNDLPEMPDTDNK